MKNSLYLLLLLAGFQAQASHLSGGYIRVAPVPGQALTYTISTIVFADPQAVATRELVSLSLCLGDGTTQVVNRKSQSTTAPDGLATALLFETTYTYPGAGTYTPTVVLTNRSGLLNIPSSITSLLALTTTFIISNAFTNQTPVAASPVGGIRVGVNQRAVISLRATDADGDSLVYSLTRPLTAVTPGGCSSSILSGYLFPNEVTQQGTFVLNGRTGELIWNAPTRQGQYDIAVYINEYRNGINISQTLEEISLFAVDQPGTPVTIPAYEPASTAGIVTAVEELRDASMQLSVFPNPVEENLQVVVQSNTPSVMVVQLFDTSGRQIHRLGSRTAVRRHEQVIGMGSLSAGTYLIRAEIAGRILMEKVVKK
ncbi:T9SS type A sorting domain-containing protein [Spirosoma rhododendri]|uniref:T9SS type A sorting domain-containing protein n=1 Tax=Spirosoma rhododendri TaxID=2728024 RepID=A0A7L5DQ31_9BACT|nr:T9SS type A sorting domain-containing protein [Spirosoma rhododendri]QJD78618.1 T9SS type A sorting domain-containing protein [Spirosoma rhododendri]